MFSLVREYDSRWYVVHDRYEYTGGVPRTLEVCSNIFQDISHAEARSRI